MEIEQEIAKGKCAKGYSYKSASFNQPHTQSWKPAKCARKASSTDQSHPESTEHCYSASETEREPGDPPSENEWHY